MRTNHGIPAAGYLDYDLGSAVGRPARALSKALVESAFVGLTLVGSAFMASTTVHAHSVGVIGTRMYASRLGGTAGEGAIYVYNDFHRDISIPIHSPGANTNTLMSTGVAQ